MRIVWSPLALERVEDTTRYIAEDNPDAAVRWVDILTVRRSSQLLRMSELGDYET